MKGIVFCEFINLADNVFGEEMVKELILVTQPASGGRYVTTGSYDYQELMAMITELGNQTGIPEFELMSTFGKHLADAFAKEFSDFFKTCSTTADLLKKIDYYAQAAIKKTSWSEDISMVSYYDISAQEFQFSFTSTYDFSSLVHGLMEGCMEYFGESYQMIRNENHHSDSNETTFTLRRLI